MGWQIPGPGPPAKSAKGQHRQTRSATDVGPVEAFRRQALWESVCLPPHHTHSLALAVFHQILFFSLGANAFQNSKHISRWADQPAVVTQAPELETSEVRGHLRRGS